jgi:hypothetical protein
MTRLILLALLLTSSSAESQISAVEKARAAYEGCVEIAAFDESLAIHDGAMTPISAAMVERAIAACATEENALIAVTALSLSPLGEIAGLKAQAYVAQYRAALKVKVMRVLLDMERSPSRR